MVREGRGRRGVVREGRRRRGVGYKSTVRDRAMLRERESSVVLLLTRTL